MSDQLPKSFFDLIEQSDKPVLVDFYADWCVPCKIVSPLVQRISKEYSGKLITIKINVDLKQDIASKYEVQGIPTIMMFYKGEPIMRLVGAHPYESLKSNIEASLPKSENRKT
jgi:thioredoxin 1